MQRTKYAARLNSFKTGGAAIFPGKNRIGTQDLLARAATVPGLTHIDLNYPDHINELPAKQVRAQLQDLGLGLNGFAMRYYTEPEFKRGAFSHPDPSIRRKAIDLTKKGIEALSEAGGELMTIWLGQDGFDYSFAMDYGEAWALEVEGLREVADFAPRISVSVEYKPNEPRSYSLLSDIGTTLLALKEAGRPNLGVTLDFAHVLYADEMPAFAAMLVARHSKLLGLHLNDGYGKRDDGLMAASVNPVATLELLYAAQKLDYKGVIYFDTFPDTADLDPVAECSANIALVDRLQAIAASLVDIAALSEAMSRQDVVSARRIINQALYGA